MPKNIGSDAKQQAIADLIAKTTHDGDYYMLLVGSSLLAIGAIFTDSIAVLIASMIIAPLASPILGLGLGIVSGKVRLMLRSAILLIFSCVIALIIAVVITAAFGSDRVPDHYISFDSNRHIAVAIAVVSGVIAAYGMVKPKVASAITGVAIAVSLMPPLVATGVNYTNGDHTAAATAFSLFALNVVGILIASVGTYLWFGMGGEYRAFIRKHAALDTIR